MAGDPAGRPEEPVRKRVMPALAYDAALRREELCSLRTDDLDPARRTPRVRAETTKNRLERVVPFSASTGCVGLPHPPGPRSAGSPLFRSESRGNHGQPPTLWTWSKVVRRIALEAGVPRFSAHTTRHLCLTDPARMGWELHAIATFAGHRNTESRSGTSISGRDLADKPAHGMEHIHAWRIQMPTSADGTTAEVSR
ncbi:site-specific integrase [Embleya sp. AB8]|uniref:site-specific integrase n=1 Tax=Embleya sp. AB8 TaxID=3156304 RepID=UPI003C760737